MAPNYHKDINFVRIYELDLSMSKVKEKKNSYVIFQKSEKALKNKSARNGKLRNYISLEKNTLEKREKSIFLCLSIGIKC